MSILSPHIPPSLLEHEARVVRLNYFIVTQNMIPVIFVSFLLPSIIGIEDGIPNYIVGLGYMTLSVLVMALSNKGYYGTSKVLHILYTNIYGPAGFAYLNPAGEPHLSWMTAYFLCMMCIPLLVFRLDVLWEKIALFVSIPLIIICNFVFPHIDNMLSVQGAEPILDMPFTRMVLNGIVVFVFIAACVIYLRKVNEGAENQVQELLQESKSQNEELMQQEEELRQGQEELLTVNQTLENHKNNLEKLVEERTESLVVAKHEVEELLAHEKENREELEKAHKELQNTQTQLVQSEKMAGLGQMTAGVAHEINNPVNFISAGVQSLKVILDDIWEVVDKYEQLENLSVAEKEEALQDLARIKEESHFDEAKEDTAHLLEDIRIGADRTAEIVKGLKTFSRLDEEEQKKANIHEGIDATLVILRNKYKDRIEIQKDYDASLREIDCYPGQLNQVFMNLLSNAVDAIEGTGTISIRTEKLAQQVKITISDTGKGISEEVRSKIFDPFFTTKDVGKGTGLGLSISHGIIDRHKGTIDVESEIDKGTSFVITLPL